MRMRTLLGLFLLLTFGCLNPPDYPDEPVIAWVGMSKDVMSQGDVGQDFINMTFGYEDGDGDLGSNDSINIFAIDSRTGNISQEFRMPFVPELGAANGISGDIQLRVNTTCCIPKNGAVPCTKLMNQPSDTLSYLIYIKDRAGHESNRIRTPVITLLCD